MPSEKSTRSAQRKGLRNRSLRTTAKTMVGKARRLIQGSDLGSADEALRDAHVVLDKTAQKGAIHRNNAARRKARLAKGLNKARQTTSGNS